MRPRWSAVVVAHNSADDLRRWIDAAARYPGLELIVVDNGSTDGSADVAESAGARVLRQRQNLGWSRASNLGASVARGEVLFFVNPDTEFKGELAPVLAERLHGEVGAVAPRFVSPDGRGQAFYFRFPTAVTGIFLYLNSGQRLDEKLGSRVIRHCLYDETPGPGADIDHAGAACLGIRADDFRRLGGYDERMWLFFSDTDLSRRLRRGGFRMHVAWDVDVVHHGQGSVSALSMDRLQVLLQRDYLQYARVAYGWGGYLFTVIAILLFSGVGPSIAGLAQRKMQAPRDSIRRVRSVFAR